MEPLTNNDIDTHRNIHKDDYTNTMCENCHDHKYILIKLDIQSEGIMAWLPKFGLSVKSCPKKKGGD